MSRVSALLCNGKKVDALLKDGMVAAFPKEHHISMKISKFSGGASVISVDVGQLFKDPKFQTNE